MGLKLTSAKVEVKFEFELGKKPHYGAAFLHANGDMENKCPALCEFTGVFILLGYEGRGWRGKLVEGQKMN